MDLDTLFLVAVWVGLGVFHAGAWWFLQRAIVGGRSVALPTLVRTLTYINMFFLILVGPLGSLTLGPVALWVWFCYRWKR